MPFLDKIRQLLHFSGRDGVVFIASLLLAFLIWLMANLSRSYPGIVSVPVVAECNIEGHSDRSANAATVVARCHTSGFTLLKDRFRGRNPQPVRVRIARQDLRSTGGEEYIINGAALHGYVLDIFGEGTSVEAFVSDTLRFRFPAQTHKKVPVELVHEVVYRPQYMSSAPLRIEPDSVTIYGESARLESVDRVTTSSLYLYDVHENMHGILRLGRVKGVRLSDTEISYTLTVSRYVELQATVPVEVWNAPPGKRLQVFPSTADVTFRCVFPVSKDPTEAFRLYVDYADFAGSLNGRCIPRALKLPPGVIDYRVTPEVFDCILTE